jgi:hypothetical protein
MLAGTAPTAMAAEATQPNLPLPEVDVETSPLQDWPRDLPMPNSMRAWHYNPAMVKPLVELGAAIQEGPLPMPLRFMLLAVVASRNACRY